MDEKLENEARTDSGDGCYPPVLGVGGYDGPTARAPLCTQSTQLGTHPRHRVHQLPGSPPRLPWAPPGPRAHQGPARTRPQALLQGRLSRARTPPSKTPTSRGPVFVFLWRLDERKCGSRRPVVGVSYAPRVDPRYPLGCEIAGHEDWIFAERYFRSLAPLQGSRGPAWAPAGRCPAARTGPQALL